MQKDFHYYATYCAALIAGYSHEESLEIAYCSQFTDCCSATLLATLKGPKAAATTQLQLELMKARTDFVGLQDITRIWASFHFLPRDLYAQVKGASRAYRSKYRLICGPNGELVRDTVELAEEGGTLQAAGLAMHVLADTWAHANFAGTPSFVINNTNRYFYELLPGPDGDTERKVRFGHDPGGRDDPEKGVYTNSVYQGDEHSIMNLGHGRGGHLPDYSFMRYKYLPAWMDYEELVKDNPSDYYHAFCQMVQALLFLRGEEPVFETGVYALDAVSPWEKEIRAVLAKRQTDSCEDWKRLGAGISGTEPEDFELGKYEEEYLSAKPEEKDGTFLGAYFLAAMAQKSMVTGKIFRSGNLLAGFSVDFTKKGFREIKDYRRLAEQFLKEGADR